MGKRLLLLKFYALSKAFTVKPPRGGSEGKLVCFVWPGGLQAQEPLEFPSVDETCSSVVMNEKQLRGMLHYGPISSAGGGGPCAESCVCRMGG